MLRSRLIACPHLRAFSASSSTALVIQRHGPGDGVVTLNVGGKQFQTLRSTIAQNAVLLDQVVRAEANAETAVDGAVFIDRDPAHFHTILTFLRSKADDVSRRPGAGADRLLKFIAAPTRAAAVSSAAWIQLPKDSHTLTELYFEAKHYEIAELVDHVCSQQTLTRLFEPFGAKNPFQMATAVVAAGRRALVLCGTVLTGMGGWAIVEQAETSPLPSAANAQVKQTDFWPKPAAFWKVVSDGWNRTNGEK